MLRTLFEIQVQAHTRCCARDFFAQPLLELLNVSHQPLVFRFHQHKVATLQQLNFGLELGKVHLCRQYAGRNAAVRTFCV